MKRDFSKKKTAVEATPDGIRSETGAPMEAHQGQLTSQLLRWDELTQDELSNLTAETGAAAQLEHLQVAERWLASAGPTPSTPCPPAEDLYDLGQGPGATSIDPLRASEVSEHLEVCTPCRELVETLASTPPVPLDLEPELAPVLPLRSVTRRGPRRMLAPLMTAAAGLLIFGLWPDSNASHSSEVLAALPSGFPESPVLRGGANELAFPRGLVLERASETLPGWASELSFEIRPASDADSFRVEVREQGVGAFEAGTLIGVLEGTNSTLAADAELLAALTPGRYSWEAWSLRDGLERSIGARDFEVQSAGSVWSTLSEAGELDSRAVRFLHELGLVTDAQRLALTLPSSAARDAYLATSLR